jgi:hypothetical protein
MKTGPVLLASGVLYEYCLWMWYHWVFVKPCPSSAESIAVINKVMLISVPGLVCIIVGVIFVFVEKRSLLRESCKVLTGMDSDPSLPTNPPSATTSTTPEKWQDVD